MGEPFPSDELGIYYTFIMNNSYHKSTRNRMWKNLSRAPKTSVSAAFCGITGRARGDLMSQHHADVVGKGNYKKPSNIPDPPA